MKASNTYFTPDTTARHSIIFVSSVDRDITGGPVGRT